MDAWSLEGRLALVTGAGRGLGRGIALGLAAAGAELLCVARSGDQLDTLVDEVRAAGGVAHAHPADVTEEAQVNAAVRRAEHLGDLRIAVTAAGTNTPGPARDYPTTAWDALFDVNVRATFLTCRAVGDSLLRRGVPGSIVTVSSQMGSVGYPGRAPYCASKHAVEGLTKALAVEWAPDGVRVNAVAPTFVETPMTRAWLEDPQFREEVLERRLPTRRFATVEEVAHAVRYLACDAAGSTTGDVLKVDGGWTAW
ncbi:SDR family NAD(P)-dependent oxidoreductase [Conexibacter sp. JD483]|uniref:SDR family NAD(P)-dependent oxidoreductase n=1 Tax=unclassified Conexibacter TaxID=2627773 RepID=UPI00271DDC92|nr:MULTISPECIES: SDR family NAD(P)-dependent oxidoreductase [unclassified Conexibacter]MDO8187764.1 SDR family NAD(P)-dependent oxidoreductase [Conexibacter sp. CPCC 205706]MDO8201373.1 SDR family NAD(P)-dependent oxidoreductase [Conexibacter sp. CPCC 205762]MDR9372858.1 SDR family NAD(P)-dependent oxidoreductase [Conexibacter sp. JD483]